MSRRKDREQAFLLVFEEIFFERSLNEILKTKKIFAILQNKLLKE